jgi:hypothetical protein
MRLRRFRFGPSVVPRLLSAAAAVLALGWTATAAHAGTVTATFSNVNPGEVVTITDGYGTSNQWSATGWAGVYNFVNAGGDLQGNLKSFCIDISQDIYQNLTVTFTTAALQNAPVPGQSMGQTRANLIAELWYQDYASIGASNSKAAAFQVAVWKIINETTSSMNVSTGTFRVTDSNDPGTLTLANQWLAALDPTGNGPKEKDLLALTSSQYQDYVVETPVPPGVVLASIGTVCFLLPRAWRYRRRFAGLCQETAAEQRQALA